AGYNRLTNPAPQVGLYSFIVMGGNDPENAPVGESYGTLKVDTSGYVKLIGTLANGTPVTFSGAIARDGSWPVYIRQAHGDGLLIGSANFHEAPTNGPSGVFFWLLPHRDAADFYPQGFYLQTTMAASVYQPESVPIANARSAALIID